MVNEYILETSMSDSMDILKLSHAPIVNLNIIRYRSHGHFW